MDHRLIEGLMEAVVPLICDHVDELVAAATAPLLLRIADLENRKTEKAEPDYDLILRLVEETSAKNPGPPGRDGKDADPAAVAELVDKAVAALPPPRDGEPGLAGKSVTLEQLTPLVVDTIAREVEKLVLPVGEKGEPGEPGKSVTLDDVVPVLEEMVAKIPPAPAGKDADPVEVAALIVEDVARLIPVPSDGKSVSLEDLAPLVDQVVSKQIAALPVAKDGVGLAGALIDREGHLVVTLTDGSAKTLGVVVGKDVDIEEVAELVRAETAKIPVPKDGVDGVGFDDMDVAEVDGDVILRFTRGDVVKEFTVPVTTYRGVWVEREYPKGASVTFGGSSWIAERPTKSKPDTPDCGWRLAVKRGRDGASAFDVARKNGFKGSEREWLDSLRPKPAAPVKGG